VDLAKAIRAAKRVYIIGNGGSYANAVHICNDLLACGVKAYTLDPATLTASANDFGYETVFARWLDVVGEPGDLLLALSGSGKSPNILQALGKAAEKGMEVWPLFGAVRGYDMQASEELQVYEGHCVMRWLQGNPA
jgi:D-sedoheptulose 7-phosphate isomerase